MARWEPNAAGRLQQAALELFEEHGFEATTVAQIAQRAGMTERTFFRHHADKREVLFAGSEELEELLVRAIEAAPVDASPLEALSHALELAGDFLGDRRSFVRARHDVIAASPELHERELAKLARLAAALSTALRSRSPSDVGALLVAEVGVAVFKTAFERWVGDEAGSLDALVRESFRDLAVAVSARSTTTAS